ncbi:MAG: hypothetical protein J6M90_03300 [Oscillospiraceae bacterium]|nr:hypothetical protein [Oscillospiraceae bacterium]
MGQIDFFEYGIIYDIILFMLFAVGVFDIIFMIVTARRDIEEKKEYAQLIVKWLGILLKAAAAVYCFIVTFTYDVDLTTKLIHAGIGALLTVDTVFSLYYKIKYGRLPLADNGGKR